MSNQDFVHPEMAACEVHGVTRQAFILRGAMAAGAVYGTSVVAPFVSQALAATMTSDADILNFALTLEYLESDFYLTKGKSLGLTGLAAQYARSFGEEEAEHVAALTSAIKGLGAKPVKKPTFSFPATNQASFLKLASVLESTGVGAYNGAGPALKDKKLLAAAGSIVQVEARHSASINLLIGASPTPDGGFDKPLSKSQVLAAAGPLIKA